MKALNYALTGFACNGLGVFASLLADGVAAKRIVWLAVAGGCAVAAGALDARRRRDGGTP